MRLILIAALLVALTACMTTSREQLDGLLGEPISAATYEFGKSPDTRVDLGGGQAAYTFKWGISGTGYGGAWTSEQMYEVVTLWTRDGVIVRYQRSAQQ